MKKQTYIRPQIEIIEVENEGIMAASPLSGKGPGGFDNGTWASTSRRGARNYQSASNMQGLEELINDILTFEK